ncbi:MAG: imidazole glycerol phosphate synthase subunit HisH [Flavobacteriales bacterium]|nr:imidazole glycerol phosphate synthase subunit HisH [Flavobacteriales bacterium]
MKTVIIQYNAGNITSVKIALERLGVSYTLSNEAEIIQQADRVIFPGVGEASSAMKYLQERNLDLVIRSLKQPVLGICLGMQLLCRYSEEGNTQCLGIIPTDVKKFNNQLKVPQIGWNTINTLNDSIFNNIPENAFVYYVHGYYVQKNDYTIATTTYGLDYSAAIRKEKFWGVQFHPEKSAQIGEQILKNFLSFS